MQIKEVARDAILVIVAVMVIATTQVLSARTIDLVRKGGVAWVLKYHHESIISRWQNIFDEIAPKQGSRQSSHNFLFGWIVVSSIRCGGGGPNRVQLIQNWKILKQNIQ